MYFSLTSIANTPTANGVLFKSDPKGRLNFKSNRLNAAAIDRLDKRLPERSYSLKN